MTAATCIAFTVGPSANGPLGEEGAWADNPADPGGATWRGITLSTYRVVERCPAFTAAQLHALSDVEVRAFYATHFYNAIQGDHLPPGLSVMVFDHAVNAGTSKSAKLLQAAVGTAEDGNIGAITLAAVSRFAPGSLIAAMKAAQEADYRGDSDFAAFGEGWLARLGRRYAASVAAGTEPS